MRFPSDPKIGQLFKPHDEATYSYIWEGHGWDIVQSIAKSDESVREDGSSSGFIKKVVDDIDNEIPIGEINGINRIFKLLNIPLIGSEYIYMNGLLQRRGLDYVMANEYFTLEHAPFPGENILCSYTKMAFIEIFNEIPSGEINGFNNIFILNNIPISQSEYVYLNGLLLTKGEEFDYTIENNLLFLKDRPAPGEILTCTYKTN
jgi:hypothetical protein